MAKAIQKINEITMKSTKASTTKPELSLNDLTARKEKLRDSIIKLMEDNYRKSLKSYGTKNKESTGNKDNSGKSGNSGNSSNTDNFPSDLSGNNTLITVITPCLAGYLDAANEKVVFNEVEKVLQSFSIEPTLLKQVLRFIKLSEESNQKLKHAVKNEALIKHLTELEKEPSGFNMAETFNSAFVEDKYQIINSVFAGLEMKDNKLTFTLRPPFWLLMQGSESNKD